MKKIIYLLAIGTYALFLTGCVPPNDDNFEPQTITPVLIAKGENCFAENLAGINMVIKTDEAWHALLDTMSLVTDSFIETEIDFMHYMVLAVIEEVKGNGGWSIDITGVTEQANKIVVAYTNLETGDATEVISQPYHIVKIPKSGKGVLFERTGENGNELEIPYIMCTHGEYYYVDTVQIEGIVYLFTDSIPLELQIELNHNYIIYNEEDNLNDFSYSGTHESIPAVYNANICNFPDFAKEWEIPDEGKRVYYKGDMYITIEYLGMPLGIGGDLILTAFKQEAI